LSVFTTKFAMFVIGGLAEIAAGKGKTADAIGIRRRSVRVR
jgi:hypothetical protein